MNPITDDLPDEAKAELAAEFRELARRFPPQRPRIAGSITAAELSALYRTGWLTTKCPVP